MTFSNSATGSRKAGPVLTSVRTVVIIALGILIDMCAVVNVPGAAVLPEAAGEDLSVSGLGVTLILLSIGCWVSVIWRDRHPLIVLIAGGFLALIGISYLLLLVGAVFVARRHPSRLRPLSVTVCGAVVLFVLREALTPWGAALPWFFGSGTDRVAPVWVVVSCAIAFAALIVVATIIFGTNSRARVAQSRFRAEHEQLRAEGLAEQMVRQAERERIARDMHDALAHRLSVVSLHAGALEGAASGAAGEIARTVREQTHAALQDMRGLIGDLRSGPGEPTPSTMRAIGSLLSDLRGGGVAITAYVFVEAPERASVQLDSAVHRIVQESLTNAIKHAAPAPIDVFVQVEPQSGARVRIVNQLSAGPTASAPGGSNGILGIRERASALDGTAWIGPHGGAFIVDVTLPWQERGEP